MLIVTQLLHLFSTENELDLGKVSTVC